MSDQTKLTVTVTAIILCALASIVLEALALSILLSPSIGFPLVFVWGVIIGSIATQLVTGAIHKWRP